MNWRFGLILFFIISYLFISLIQIIASIDGILYFFGLHWVFALFAALILVFIPGIGPLAGVYGAVEVWGWSILASVFLFFWPYILYGILVLLGISFSFLNFQSMKKYYKKRPEVIEASYTVKKEDN